MSNFFCLKLAANKLRIVHTQPAIDELNSMPFSACCDCLYELFAVVNFEQVLMLHGFLFQGEQCPCHISRHVAQDRCNTAHQGS